MMTNKRRAVASIQFESLERRWLLSADPVGGVSADLPVEIDNVETVEVATPHDLLRNASPWQNPTNRCDVNGDGFITPIDALAAINDLNQHGAREVPMSQGESSSPSFFLDVNGDRFISPTDVLAIINYLNADPLDVNGSGTVDWTDAHGILAQLQQHGPSVLPDPEDEFFAELSRFDTNRDGQITHHDALVIINAMNRRGEITQ